MTITDIQRQVLVALVRRRLENAPLNMTFGELAQLVGRNPARDSLMVAGQLDGARAWLVSQSLPDLTTTVISQENAEKMRMLPPQKVIDHYGSEQAVRDAQQRVRDFDWHGWVES